MTEAEWLNSTAPEPMLAFLSSNASDRQIRLFACACCRRIWSLVGDERLRSAILVGERFAEGRAKVRDLLTARDAADQAAYNASCQEYCTEVDAHFSSTAEYIHAQKTAWASRAARIVVSRKAARPDQRRYHHGKAGRITRRMPEDTASRACAFAVESEARAAVCERFGFRNPSGIVYPQRPPQAWSQLASRVVEPVRQTGAATLRREQAAQALLLREVLGNPFRPAARDPAWLTPSVVTLAQSAYDERSLPIGCLAAYRLAVLADALEEAGCGDAAILSHLRSPGPHVRGCFAVDLVLGLN